MKITTWNVNGLRAAIRKGFGDWLERIDPDVLLLQEIRVRPDQLPPEWREPDGWHVIWHPAERPGYAGTALWSRTPVTGMKRGAGDAGTGDPEGRVLVGKTRGIRCASIYLPSGSSSEARQTEKNRWLGFFGQWAEPMSRSRIPTVLGGDFNIAHTERDLYHWRSNQKQSGFLPHEREWMGDFIDGGWRDYVRDQAGDIDGPYTWWSNMGKARERDRGWRIDYLFANKAASRRASSYSIDREAGLAVSDHAPVSIEIDAPEG